MSLISFAHHRVEKTQVQKGKCINVTDGEVVKKYQIMYDYTEVKYKQPISHLCCYACCFVLVRAKRNPIGAWQVRECVLVL